MLYEIYFSPTGGTKKTADIICGAWADERKEVDLTERDLKMDEMSFDSKDICIIAVPSFGGRVPGIALSSLKKASGGSARAILVVVYGNRDYDDTLLELKDTVQNAGFRCAAAIAAVAEHSIMRQFAAGRPDEDDRAELEGFAEQIQRSLLGSDSGKKLAVPGNFPYREYGGVPMKPAASKECTKCGTCAVKCPVNAIPREDPSRTDTDICISCMRCIAVCPRKARRNNKMMLTAAAMKLKKDCEKRKKNQLFL